MLSTQQSVGNTLEIALAEDGVLFGNKQLPWGISHICVSMTYVFHGHSPYMRYPGVSMDSVCFWKKKVASKNRMVPHGARPSTPWRSPAARVVNPREVPSGWISEKIMCEIPWRC